MFSKLQEYLYYKKHFRNKDIEDKHNEKNKDSNQKFSKEATKSGYLWSVLWSDITLDSAEYGVLPVFAPSLKQLNKKIQQSFMLLVPPLTEKQKPCLPFAHHRQYKEATLLVMKIQISSHIHVCSFQSVIFLFGNNNNFDKTALPLKADLSRHCI